MVPMHASVSVQSPTCLEQKLVQLTDLVHTGMAGVHSEIRSLKKDLSYMQKKLEKRRHRRVSCFVIASMF